MDRASETVMTTSKQKVINQVLHLGKNGKVGAVRDLPVLERFLYAICREGVTPEAADRAFDGLQKRFFDWNEIRVSSAREIADAIEEFVPDAEIRGQRLIDFLQEVFESTFSFDLESMQKKGLKQAAKQLARYQAASDFAVAWVIQKSLGGHAIPVDAPSLRVLRRLGVLEEGQNDSEAQRASLEHQVPKAKGAEFVDLISVLADEHCWDPDPACPACPLGKVCPTGIETKLAAVSTSHKKPR